MLAVFYLKKKHANNYAKIQRILLVGGEREKMKERERKRPKEKERNRGAECIKRTNEREDKERERELKSAGEELTWRP